MAAILQNYSDEWSHVCWLPALPSAVHQGEQRITRAADAVHMEKEDAIPEQVVFTVNFFDTLYLVTCMQTISPQRWRWSWP